MLVFALAAAGASAEVGGPGDPTVQAVAANAAWLAYTPPPPGGPGVVCLVDTGVDPNPDTQLVGAGTLDASAGTGDADDTTLVAGHPFDHGTEMAMIMAAPNNGWGMVGIAPTSVRVYSLRAVPAGATAFPFGDYSWGIAQCQELRDGATPAITVVNLSLGGTTSPGTAGLQELEDSVDGARLHGLDVVAASGDAGGSALDYPAAYGPVVAVGASDAATGAPCAFSQGGGAVDLLAPGCDAQTGGLQQVFADDGNPAVGTGTSQASAIVSAVLASMRAYQPSLTVSGAEQCLTSTAHGGVLDAAAAFNACGLGATVSAGEAAMAVAQPPAPAAAPSGPRPTALQAPRLARLRRHRGRLMVRALNLPAGARLAVQSRRGHGWGEIRTVAGATASIASRGVLRVRARFEPRGAGTPSPWTVVTLSR
ncbi:MAG TPA: S8/S53 family peptidase [Solirubrobacteraceae bacterium]|nr:S8/S53 family peptidase [Solirubrobacteraceae bacterium]